MFDAHYFIIHLYVVISLYQFNNDYITLYFILTLQVIQRRDDIGDPIRENFNRDWTDYKNGFGDPTKEFWMGNENIYMLTSNDEYMLRIELEDFEGNRR